MGTPEGQLPVESATAAWAEAESLLRAGQLDAARRHYAKLREDRKFAPYAALRLSAIAHMQMDFQGATACALSACAAASRDSRLLDMLVKRLLPLGETEAAVACAEDLATLEHAGIQHLAESGKTLSDHMLPAQALQLLDAVMAKGLDTPAIAYLSGLNRLYLGDFEQARQLLLNAVGRDHTLIAAWWALAKMLPRYDLSAWLPQLHRVVAALPDAHPDASLANYALFHFLDAYASPDRAWPALANAMRLRRAQVAYNEPETVALFEKMHRVLSQQRRCDGARSAEGAVPIFVVGMPRTGTTVIDQHLCSTLDAVSAGELPDFVMQMRWVANAYGPPQPDLDLLRAMDRRVAADVGARYLSHVHWRRMGHGLFTDKLPDNYMLVPQILAALGDARVLVVRRDPMDACFSNLKEWFGRGYAYSYVQEEAARQFARFDGWVRRLETLGDRRIAILRYEDFVASPRSAMLGVAHQWGLQTSVEGRDPVPAKGAVATASAIQAREAVTARKVGAWQRYAARLAPMRQELSRAGIIAG